MGFDCPIEKQFHFIYKSKLDNNLTEHELDYVFTGTYEGEIYPNPEEVESYKYMKIKDLEIDVEQHPQSYTEWFKICLKEVLNRVEV